MSRPTANGVGGVIRCAYLGVMLSACAGALVGCAADPLEAEVPDGEATAARGGRPGAKGTNDVGRQGPQAARPPMNAAAVGPYKAGQAAFRKGDLAAARTQFKAATAADSNAFEAYYALGTTHQRLAETDLAAEAYRR